MKGTNFNFYWLINSVLKIIKDQLKIDPEKGNVSIPIKVK